MENPVKSFSIAAGRSPAKESVFTTGAPLINAEGKVVAVFSGSQILAAQTLRYAYPLAGCAERITAAVKKDERLPVPISGEHRPYHPWFAHGEHRLLEAAQIARDVARAREHARRLVEAFPDCLGPRVLECGAAELGTVSGTVTPLEYLELVKRAKPAADANPVSMSAYHQRLGTALCRAGLTEEGLRALQKAFEVAPSELAAANLSSYHMNRGDLKEAEHWLRRAAEIAPERFDFLTRLVSLLEKAGNWEEADKLADRIYALERLYSSR